MNNGSQIFLRDDDLVDTTDATRAFVELFRERGIPVSYQVIPALLTDACAAWIRRLQAETPGLIELGQHGLAHEMTVAGRRETHEFGPERDLSEQRDVIERGRALMDAKLGDAWNRRLFTPPRHRFNRDTLQALADAGFSIVSASRYPGWKHDVAHRVGGWLGRTNLGARAVSHHGRVRPEAAIREISIAVAIDDGPYASIAAHDIETVMARVARASRRPGPVGLMFHHEAWGSAQGLAALSTLADRLLAIPGASFVTIGQAAAALDGAAPPAF